MQADDCEEIIAAGFGGQGIILVGKVLAQAAMQTGREVTYMPSYGAEVRGGTANCMVVISNRPIASPVVSRPSSAITMNKASLNKFAPRVKAGGLLIFNSSLIDGEPQVDDSVEVAAVPADELAAELGSPRSANMVALGAYLQRRRLLGIEDIVEALPAVLAKRHHDTLATNIEALHRGAAFVASRAECR